MKRRIREWTSKVNSKESSTLSDDELIIGDSTQNYEIEGKENRLEQYLSRLFDFIPAPLLIGYTFLQSTNKDIAYEHWQVGVILLFGLILLPLNTYRKFSIIQTPNGEREIFPWYRIVMGVLAFNIYVVYLGGPLTLYFAKYCSFNLSETHSLWLVVVFCVTSFLVGEDDRGNPTLKSEDIQ